MVDGQQLPASPKEFEFALTQVMRARGGLIEELGSGALRYGGGAVIPVIFTTASLLTTETELASADDTGRLPSLDAVSREWVWFDHNLTRTLRPLNVKQVTPTPQMPPTKSEFLRTSLNTRSVAIVNESGIEAFLAELPQAVERSPEVVATSSEE